MEYIAIDPDIYNIGICYLEGNRVSVGVKNIGEFLTDIAKNNPINTTFRIEAGWLNQSNWHVKPDMSRQTIAELGKRLGENFGAGKTLVQTLISMGCRVELMRPKDSKQARKEWAQQFIPSIKNQEMVDAMHLLRDKIDSTKTFIKLTYTNSDSKAL